MSVVAILPTKAMVEELWDRYCALSSQVLDNPRVLLSRDFHERLAVAKSQFDRAYIAWCGQ